MIVVDRQARNRAALLLRRLAGGRITNDHFEEEWPFSEDPAIQAIGDGATRRFVARLTLFLNSDRA